MSKENKKCNSCNDEITASGRSVEFKCPACSENVIRCTNCRKLMVKYKCKCGFEGP